MDAFKLRSKIVADYSRYIKSFLKIRDPKIENFVETELAHEVLWPEPLLQLSPAYKPAENVRELADAGVLHPSSAQIFKSGNGSLLLHQHQRTAIEVAAQGRNYVVTTGTGSGKSLTYILPIFDYILKNNPQEAKVRAIIVYPMNALINSQEQALDRFVANLPGGKESCPVRYARYTGQESNERKKEIQQNPPHILLTNYVMLELMLTRPEESGFVNATASALQFLVLDELHTYRGRQGADVAYLVRRLRERCGNPALQCIGTSATMSAGSTRLERAREIAGVASRIFGSPVEPSDVIDETLRRILSPETKAAQPSDAALRAVLVSQAPFSANWDWEDFRKSPLAVWIEDKFGLELDSDGKLKRPKPITLKEGATELALRTGVDAESCASKLRQFFNLGSKVRNPEGLPGFAFKLHQFFSQGDSVYATLETSEKRDLTLYGQVYSPNQQEKLLFPLVFCRECGQEYYLCTYNLPFQTVVPRPPVNRELTMRQDEVDGYLAVDTEGFWSDENIEVLPETWFKELKSGRKLKPEYERFKPRHLSILADGTVLDMPDTMTAPCWFIPTPFMTCLRCGEIYTRRQGEFSKLARLSSEGRSTATTLLALSSIIQMKSDTDLEPEAQKLLSFTDNRQDASLQAGHFNDFIEVSHLRSAIYRALQQNPDGLSHTTVASAAVDELHLPQESYAREIAPNPRAPLFRRNRQALQDLIEYRIYEDLRRGWRFLQPNLEQAGLLVLDYDGIEDLCSEEALWQNNSLLAGASIETRGKVVRGLLDYMRRELAISADCLDRSKQEGLVKRIRAALNDSYGFDENEQLHVATKFVLPGTKVITSDERSLSFNTSIGRYLRSAATWAEAGLDHNLDRDEYAELVNALIPALKEWGLLLGLDATEGQDNAVQVRSDSLIWRAGDGKTVARDYVRRKRMDTGVDLTTMPNQYFSDLYKTSGESLVNIEGREHTGQVAQKDREEREKRFRSGSLSALFCSPTMELGIDIATLNMVHLRNVPPTPANYAQRSGRAGRSGTPALVATYCSVGSGHDQYFFRQPARMVSGVVVPPRLDLTNEELISAHVHAVWLSMTGLGLGRSMTELVDAANAAQGYPLQEHIQATIQRSPARLEECFQGCRRILLSALPEAERESGEWEAELHRIIARTPEEFDRACDRWRTLYDSAQRQLNEARDVFDSRHYGYKTTTKAEAEEGERREREAKRQIKLLCNTLDDEQGDTDFYPYRYFASEGFLPGYNFPRLPVQAFLPTGREKGTFLARPRFMALTEFGPRNIIYHEGDKYRVTKVMLPTGGVESRLVSARLCYVCGFFHEGTSSLSLDVCESCGTRLDGDSSLSTQRLFEMTTVGTQRVERITSEEEERSREGFHITSHYHWSQAHPPVEAQIVAANEPDEVLLELQFGPAATLWRINHRWRRATTDGFTLDTRHGLWAKKPEEDFETTPAGIGIGNEPVPTLSGIRLLVRDTRNILLLNPNLQTGEDEGRLATLQYALQRGIEAVFQIEEQELASERIGKGGQRRILLWEAAEGGVGVLGRLAGNSRLLAEVARAALEICHFDPESGAEKPNDNYDCGRACYHCLLSYSNQSDHRLLDRHEIRELLLELAHGQTAGSSAQTPGNKPGNQSLEGETAQTGGNSDNGFAYQVLEYLKANGRKLPDLLNPVLQDTMLQPDFFYQKGAACVFCDEEEPSKAVRRERAELEDYGYRVVTLVKSGDWQRQFAKLPDIF